MIIVECPQCNTALRIPEQYAGQVGSCKKCGGRIHVPVVSAEEEENWLFQPPAPILPTDASTPAPPISPPPVITPVVSPPLVQPFSPHGEFVEPFRYSRRRPERSQKDEINKQFLIGLVGSIALCIGVFSPLLSAPIVGSQNLFANSQEVGGIVLLLGVTSLGAVFLKKYEALWLTGLGGLAMTVRAFLQFQYEKEQMKTGDQDDPFLAEVGRAMADTVQIEWGWAVLLVGSILLIACAAIHDERNKP